MLPTQSLPNLCPICFIKHIWNSKQGRDFVRRIISVPFLLLIRFYQVWISPMLPKTCRFMPTCSAYAYEAITKYGILKGGFLSIKRIAKCHPFHPGGYDPVP
ncbi:MAG: membrane protein insertion efficiency factor YidD [Eubacteriaceae bacterium]|nr:membrane protein insertion efficiency factor YidD [Eubacteriaceae bacterium]